jgi:hypothetical protein
MEEDFGGGQGLTNSCGAKGRRRRRITNKCRLIIGHHCDMNNLGKGDFGC